MTDTHPSIADGLINLGMERLESGFFRGTVDADDNSGRRHNVFVSLGEHEISVSTPIGPADQITDEYLSQVREPDDKCAVRVAASSALLEMTFDASALTPDDMIALLSVVLVDHGRYGDRVEQRLAPLLARRADRATLVNAVSTFLNDADGLLDGRFTVQAVSQAAEAAIDAVGDPEFLGLLHDHAVRYSMATWAERGGDLGSNPWNQVAENIKADRVQRGWPEVYPDPE